MADLDPLDGVSDPWRWWPANGSWVGPAYHVTWADGDLTADIVTPGDYPGSLLTMFVTSAATLAAVFDDPGVWQFSTNPEASLTTQLAFIAADQDHAPFVATEAGSGIVFLRQHEADFGGPTQVPDATIDVLDWVGDITVDAEYPWPATATSSEYVAFPDVEALTVAYLRAHLADRDDTATVATEVPNPRPPRLVKVTRTGGAATWPVTDEPTVVVQCWDTATVDASTLARLIRALLWMLPADTTYGANVRRVVEVGGPAFFPDPATDLPRYQFTVQLNVRGDPL